MFYGHGNSLAEALECATIHLKRVIKDPIPEYGLTRIGYDKSPEAELVMYLRAMPMVV